MLTFRPASHETRPARWGVCRQSFLLGRHRSHGLWIKIITKFRSEYIIQRGPPAASEMLGETR